MNRGTNFGQPIEHTIPVRREKKNIHVVRQRSIVQQVFEFTMQERLSDVSENLIMKIRSKDKNWRKQEFSKKGYKKYYGSKKVHKHK